MRRIYIMCIMLFFFCDCQKEFDVREPTDTELCLICFPGRQDTTVIQLYNTVPIGGRYEGTPFLNNASLAYAVNSVSKEVKYASSTMGSIPQGCWFVEVDHKSGDYVEIIANTIECEMIKASTIIPPPPPDFEFECTNSAGAILTIRFDDDQTTADYYGIALICERTIYKSGDCFTEVKNLNLVTDGYGTHEISVIRDHYDVGFTGSFLWPRISDNYGVRIWPDTIISGNKAVLSARFGSGYFDIEPDNSQETRRYKVRLYRFTEDFYKHIVALNYQVFNDYATYGIAPMMPSYTNVEGGCGIFAGWSMRDSDWFEMK